MSYRLKLLEAKRGSTHTLFMPNVFQIFSQALATTVTSGTLGLRGPLAWCLILLPHSLVTWIPTSLLANKKELRHPTLNFCTEDPNTWSRSHKYCPMFPQNRPLSQSQAIGRELKRTLLKYVVFNTKDFQHEKENSTNRYTGVKKGKQVYKSWTLHCKPDHR